MVRIISIVSKLYVPGALCSRIWSRNYVPNALCLWSSMLQELFSQGSVRFSRLYNLLPRTSYFQFFYVVSALCFWSSMLQELFSLGSVRFSRLYNLCPRTSCFQFFLCSQCSVFPELYVSSFVFSRLYVPQSSTLAQLSIPEAQNFWLFMFSGCYVLKLYATGVKG